MTQNNAVQSLQVAELFIRLNQTVSDLYTILGLASHLKTGNPELCKSLECSIEEISKFLESSKLTIEEVKNDR